MTTITRERLLKIQQWSETYGAGSNVMLPAEEAEELARITLASLTAEPVAWRLLDSPESSVTVTDNEKMAAIWKRNGRNVQPLYSTAHGSADAVGMVVSEGRQPSAHNPDSRIFEVLVESGYEPVPGDKLYAAPPASEREQIRRKTEPVAYLVCNGRLYQDRPFLDLSTARKSVKDRNDGAEIKALCVCEISAEK
ncbi:hypothetical protein BWL78_14370 [Salmonella enterica]|nr:hypothetical protein [Salmonella enterica]